MSASAVQPYGSWDEGLLALCDALDSSDRTAIVVARLASTVKRTGISAEDICALALIAPPGASFVRDSSNDADAVTFGIQQRHPAISEKENEVVRILRDSFANIDKTRKDRANFILSAFPERDARRILLDTTFGISAAALADFSQELAESDPFCRLSQRLSLWFKPSSELMRYGLPWPQDSRPIDALVIKLLDKITGENAEPARRLLRIWAGEEKVPRSVEGLKCIVRLAYDLTLGAGNVLGPEKKEEWRVLAFESCESLIQDCDDAQEVAEFDQTVGGLVLRQGYDPNIRVTADLREWLKNYRKVDLTCDPSNILRHLAFQAYDWPDKPMAIAKYAAREIVEYGHAVYSTGPFPIAYANSREGGLRSFIAEVIPECADLIRLLELEGEECEDICCDASYWATLNPDDDNVSVRWAVSRAHQRQDFSLCDILIGTWLLHCALFLRLPLPYVSDLARSIRKIPSEDRRSLTSVLSVIQREVMDDSPLRRSVEALLSYLPPVPITPARSILSEMREEWFGPELWDKLADEEQRRLLRSEERFQELRRIGPDRVDSVGFDHMFVDWSSLTESLLFRAMCKIDASHETMADSEKSLGRLISKIQTVKRSDSDREGHYGRLLPRSTSRFLEKLNEWNLNFGKHIGGGSSPRWDVPVGLRSGLYFSGILKSLMEKAYP